MGWVMSHDKKLLKAEQVHLAIEASLIGTDEEDWLEELPEISTEELYSWRKIL